ncbi:hypothetical protein [Micromonospora sp. CPCC 206061]|uniref:hypothetical protein n=1 Tax=Micromonospora sp. CPCC 206061 TaxID=3122410 RepID=UPI002FEFF708
MTAAQPGAPPRRSSAARIASATWAGVGSSEGCRSLTKRASALAISVTVLTA